jgi:hypothetical protein
LRSFWFPLASLPYFALYGRELALLRYPAGDLLRVYALNLMLAPVQLAGVASSLVQAATGRKARFARTPKMRCRTPAPPSYHLAELGLLVLMLVSLGADVAHARWFHAGFVAANLAALVYALTCLVGLRAIREDFRLARGGGAPASDFRSAPGEGRAKPRLPAARAPRDELRRLEALARKRPEGPPEGRERRGARTGGHAPDARESIERATPPAARSWRS